jgi:excisionase family DNA binding protein
MELMTIKQTAAFLRVSMGTVRNMVQRGDLPALRVGKQIRFVREDLEHWVRRQVAPRTQPARTMAMRSGQYRM